MKVIEQFIRVEGGAVSSGMVSAVRSTSDRAVLLGTLAGDIVFCSGARR